MKYQENKKLCQAVLESIKDLLPPNSYQQANEWINQYGEWGLGLECVIDWIGDLELQLTHEQFMHIEKAMVAMGWAESRRMIWLREYMNTTFNEKKIGSNDYTTEHSTQPDCIPKT